MNIKFQDSGFQYSINSILMFQTEEQSDWWKKSLFYFYPSLDQKYFDSLSQPKRESYLEETLADFYIEHQSNIKEKGALGVSIHELIHFVWFYVWHNHFHDSYEEYETPNLKWIFSEIVVEPIMRVPRLSSINPYFKTGCVYDYFYTMKIKGKPILDTMNTKYKTLPITTFMEEGYNYCLTHEKEIRMQIK